MSQDIQDVLKRKFVLRGRAEAQAAIIQFLTKLQEADEQEQSKKKEQRAAETQKEITGLDMPAKNESKFSGVADHLEKKRKSIREQFGGNLDARLARLDEEIATASDKNALFAETGQLIVDGQVIMNNHADILKVLTMWLMDNRPEVLQNAIAGIADMVHSGALFRR